MNLTTSARVGFAHRLAQETLTNAVKHSHARSVTIKLDCQGDTLTLRLADDGAGLDPAAAPGVGTGRFGLHGMRERAERLGGTLAIEGAPGRGTTVTLKAPLK